jgi:pimeloyl-ACP methyl ester carboxylesterase
VPKIRANQGVDIEYESIGSGEPLVLIMGIGSQLIMWPDELCRMFAERGFRVIRFDNRDVGLSTKLDGQRVGDLRRLMLRALLGRRVEAPYTLLDMADDVAGLLDGLGLESAHVAGVSLGGMVAQSMAIAHPHRVRTLTSIMSTAGRPHRLGSLRAMRTLLGPAPKNRDEAIARTERFYSVCGSTGFPRDWDRIRDVAGRAYDRCFYPVGFLRQFAAAAATGSRYEALRFVRIPTHVIHGSVDPLIVPAAGRDVARAVPGATLRIIEGMGHDLPAAIWPTLVGDVAELAGRTRASTPRAAQAS